MLVLLYIRFILPFIVGTECFQIYVTAHGRLVRDLDMRIYLQDEVVSWVLCHRKGMCIQVLSYCHYLRDHHLL